MTLRVSTRLLLLSTTVVALLGCSATAISRPQANSQYEPKSASPSVAAASASPTPTVDPRVLLTSPMDQEHLAFGDHVARTYLFINMDPGSAFVGRFAFAVEGGGLYWGDGAADVTSRSDGSAQLSYDGPGWHDAAGTFDPLLWSYRVTRDPSPVSFRLEGVVGADRSTASARLLSDGRTYELDDTPPIPGADDAMAEIEAFVEAEDWRSLYLRIHRTMKATIDETTFVSRMTDGMLPYGSITSATVTSPAKVSDTGLGWDVATARLDVTFSRDGGSATYPVTIELMADGEFWWLSSISPISPDASPSIGASASRDQ